LFSPTPQFYPGYGSALAYLTPARGPAVPFAALPFPFRNVHDVPCQGGGFLGATYDPFRIDAVPAARRYLAEMLQRTEGLGRSRLNSRRRLLETLDRAEPAGGPG